MAENTNIEVDGRKEMALIQRFLDMCESHWEGKQRTTKERLARKLQKSLGAGGKATVQVIPEKYTRDAEIMFEKANIGYTSFPDTINGQTVFAFNLKDADKVQAILNLIYLNDPTRNKSIKADNIADLGKRLKVNVISLNLSGTDYENLDKISADKFYANNMVGSTELNKDYVIETHAYNHGSRDLSTLLVELSAYKYLERTDKKNFDARLAQAEYDHKVESDFAEAVMMSSPMTIAGTDKNFGSYVKYDGTSISIRIKSKSGQLENISLNPNDYGNKNDLMIAIRQYTSKIHNMACYTPEEMRDPNCIKYERPSKGSSTTYSFVNTDFDKLLTELAVQADEIIQYSRAATVETKVRLKTEYIERAFLSIKENNESGGKIPMNPLVERYITARGVDTKDNVQAARIQFEKEKMLTEMAEDIRVLKGRIKTETPAMVKSYAKEQNLDMSFEKERTA